MPLKINVKTTIYISPDHKECNDGYLLCPFACRDEADNLVCDLFDCANINKGPCDECIAAIRRNHDI